MKKIISVLLLLTFLIQSTGVVLAENELVLSDTTRISSTAQDCYAEATKDEFYGDGGYSLHMYTTGEYLEIGQNYTEALEAGTYTLTYYGKGTGLLWFYSNWGEWMRTDGAVAEPQSDGWTKYTYEIAIDGNGDTSFLFHNNGSIDFYLDEISLVDENGTDYIIDGGFNEVTGDTEEPPVDPEEPPVDPDDIPDEELTLSDTTKINVENTENCFAKVTDNEKVEGDYSLHLKAGASDWLEVTQTLTETVISGEQYIMTIYVKPVTGKIWFRVDWDDTAWLASHQSEFATEMEGGWVKLEKEVTVATNQTKFLFHNDGATEFYIDNISLVKVGDTENLVPDGGFEEVTVAGGEEPEEPPVDPDEPEEPPVEPEEPPVEPDEPEEETGERYPNELVLSDTTIINGTDGDTCYAVVTDDEFYGDDGYGLHLVSSGNPDFTVTQMTTESMEAGEEYVLTVYGKKVNGRVWFRVGWGDDAWMVAADDGEDAGDGWKKYQKTLIIDADGATNLFFYSDQVTEFYLDDISLIKVGEEENLMPDGGFDEVTVIEPDIPDYDVYEPVLKKGTQIVENVSAIGEYSLTVTVKNNAVEDGLPVEVLVAVFNESGEMLSLYSSDDEPVLMTEPNGEDADIEVPFEIEAEGCNIDVYVINNRQDIDSYYNPVSY